MRKLVDDGVPKERLQGREICHDFSVNMSMTFPWVGKWLNGVEVVVGSEASVPRDAERGARKSGCVRRRAAWHSERDCHRADAARAIVLAKLAVGDGCSCCGIPEAPLVVQAQADPATGSARRCGHVWAGPPNRRRCRPWRRGTGH